MYGRELVRSMKVFGSVRGLRTVRAAWRQRRTDARQLPPRGPERARVPGLAVVAEASPGGGTIRFARSVLRVCVSAGGTVFWAWDGAGPLPSYALAGEAPDPDPRAVLEPDTDGGWRIVSERVTVAVSRRGAVEIRTPGGVMLRRDLPPRWWDPVSGPEDAVEGPAAGAGQAPAGAARWVQRSELPADARLFG
ncbi:glycosyl hydrolase, partial [Streptomyces sp. CBMA370]|nr:glycosyl hydrolase [Streptomyces sp. CBMA370]